MDSHVYPDYVVPLSYDSLLGKHVVLLGSQSMHDYIIFLNLKDLIVWDPTHEKAIERMKRALDDTIITVDKHEQFLEALV
ncbi:hypothetical protein RND71_034484 [Anisodus tanguticus]|uniref:Uncharacterized protein n=1 Tax=Anisodus tanguticus TaxID=243964 RepID=A0AAE1V523_9SOLA|nr:hypothetical protein RND71_034484 [Anisodus tanguticus]